MNPSGSDPHHHWDQLLRTARADQGPEADVPSLLRALQREKPAEAGGWTSDFSRLFASRRVIAGCLAGASAFAVIASWHAWNAWQCVPWAQLLDPNAGGGL
jgi:hypothetical protein